MRKLEQLIRRIPLLGPLSLSIYKNFKKRFPGSANYWEQRYAKSGNSGSGSYAHLAEFKAEVLNEFVNQNNIKNVIEFGSGDGNQLTLAKYPSYIGLDVSKTAIRLCMEKFKNDTSKSFFLYDSLAFYDNSPVFKADLSLSLDVIYHLIEDEIFDAYMTHLFNSSTKFVIIYSSNIKKAQNYHVKERDFTKWIEKNKPDWRLLKKIDNKYKSDSMADFFIYQK